MFKLPIMTRSLYWQSVHIYQYRRPVFEKVARRVSRDLLSYPIVLLRLWVQSVHLFRIACKSYYLPVGPCEVTVL